MSMLVEADELPPSVTGAYSDADIEAALLWASSRVEAYCERDFGYVADDTIVVDPLPNRSAHLPHPPVSAVASVQGWMDRDGVMDWWDIPNHRWTSAGLLYDTAGMPGVAYELPSWPTQPKSLRVTYSHGYTSLALPQPVKDAVIKAAAHYLTDPTGRLVQVDDVRLSDRVPVLDEELLDRYRLVSIA